MRRDALMPNMAFERDVPKAAGPSTLRWVSFMNEIRVFIPLLFLIIAGCATDPFQRYLAQFPQAQSQYDYELRIFDYYGAVGYGHEYFISRQRIIILIQNDFGLPKREVAAVPLSAEQVQTVFAVIDAIPFESLQEQYVNPGIQDGLKMSFDFKLPTRVEKRITLANMQQEDLFRLVDAVNQLVPRQFALWQVRASASGNAINLQ